MKSERLNKPSLVLSVAPIPGESLSGLLARAAARNVISSSRNFLAPIGLSVSRLSSLATTCYPHINQIAVFLGVDSSAINNLFYRVQYDDPKKRAQISISKMALPVRAREARSRRVSFQSLRNSPHHRASWELRFLPWCPESLEILVDTCPSCGTQLGWQTICGVHVCERCSSDLRTFEGRFVSEDRQSFAQSFSRLFSIDRAERMAARDVLHDELKGLPDHDLLQLIVAVGRAFQIKRSEVNNLLFSTSVSDLEVKCDTLLLGVKRILNWENSISELLTESRKNADRDSGYGVANQFGVIANFLRPKTSEISTLLRGNIIYYCRQNKIIPLSRLGFTGRSERDGWVVTKKMIAQLNTNNDYIKKFLQERTIKSISSSAGLRSPILVKSEDVARLRQECADAIEIRHCETLTGLPEFVLHELMAMGILLPATPDVRVLRGKREMLSKSSLDCLGLKLFDLSTKEFGADDPKVSLCDALEIGSGEPFFASVLFSRIASGAIKLERNGNDSVCLGLRFYVKAAEVECLLNSDFDRSAFADHYEKMPRYITYECAARFLGVKVTKVYGLVKNGRLPTTKVGRYAKISREELYARSSRGLLS